jgi:hypothetical protein
VSASESLENSDGDLSLGRGHSSGIVLGKKREAAMQPPFFSVVACFLEFSSQVILDHASPGWPVVWHIPAPDVQIVGHAF